MIRSIRFLSALAAIGFCSAVSAAPSTFQNSCKDIKLAEDASKITANCKKKDGTPVPATIDITGVENIDGKLTRTGKKTNFQETCHTPHLSTNDKHVVADRDLQEEEWRAVEHAARAHGHQQYRRHPEAVVEGRRRESRPRPAGRATGSTVRPAGSARRAGGHPGPAPAGGPQSAERRARRPPDQFPHTGARLPTNARTPSRKSSLP